jgi:hypothetical protein
MFRQGHYHNQMSSIITHARISCMAAFALARPRESCASQHPNDLVTRIERWFGHAQALCGMLSTNGLTSAIDWLSILGPTAGPWYTVTPFSFST